jgi:hypothetical protein
MHRTSRATCWPEMNSRRLSALLLLVTAKALCALKLTPCPLPVSRPLRASRLITRRQIVARRRRTLVKRRPRGRRRSSLKPRSGGIWRQTDSRPRSRSGSSSSLHDSKLSSSRCCNKIKCSRTKRCEPHKQRRCRTLPQLRSRKLLNLLHRTSSHPACDRTHPWLPRQLRLVLVVRRVTQWEVHLWSQQLQTTPSPALPDPRPLSRITQWRAPLVSSRVR